MQRVRTSFLRLAALSPIVLGFGAHATPITWTFYETSAIDCGVFRPPCPPTSFPLPLATLELDSETSSGHSVYSAPPTGSFHINTGASFRLTFPLTAGLIASPTFPEDGQTMCCTRPTDVSDFDISWNEVSGDLLFARVVLNANAYNASIEMSRFSLATDSPIFGGCASITNLCAGAGFWQSDRVASAQVAEPTTLSLLITAFLGLGFLYNPRKD